jgi:hypothetical protein
MAQVVMVAVKVTQLAKTVEVHLEAQPQDRQVLVIILVVAGVLLAEVLEVLAGKMVVLLTARMAPKAQ